MENNLPGTANFTEHSTIGPVDPRDKCTATVVGLGAAMPRGPEYGDFGLEPLPPGMLFPE